MIDEVLREEEKPSKEIQEIQKELDKIQKTLSDVAIRQQLSENKSFEDVVNKLNFECSEAIKIQKFILEKQAYIDEINKKAEKSPEDIKDLEEFEAKKEKFASCVTDKSFTELILKIENNLNGREIGREKDSFTNYFEVQNKNLKFKKDALEKSYAYQESILQVYLTAVSLNMGALGKNYDLAVSKGERLKADNIKDELKTSSDSCKETLEAYDKIIKDEEQAENKYYYDKDNYIKISGVGRAKIKKENFYSMGGSLVQPSMIKYIERGNDEFDEYFEHVNEMIKEYTDTEKYTLRTFLESKGFDIPKEAEYLIAGKNECVPMTSGYGHRLKIPVYVLDKSSNETEYFTFLEHSSAPGFEGCSFSDTKYFDNDKLCYFLEEARRTSDCLAEVSNGEETVYFDNIEEAWNTAISWCGPSHKIKFKLNSDWIATKLADGSTSFGQGRGFKNGAICTDCGVENAYLAMDQITIDLNGHKIDRNTTEPIKDGSVIIAERTPLKIIDSSGTNNGLITGGNTTGDGGGIKVCGWASLTVENCTITNNRAKGYGGGVSLDNLSTLFKVDAGYFYNTQIINNTTAKSDMGKDVAVKIWGAARADMTIGGKVKIGECLLEASWCSNNIIHIDPNRQLTSDSSIGIYCNNHGKWIQMTSNNNRNYKDCFHSNLNGYKIENYSYSSGEYLYLEKK